MRILKYIATHAESYLVVVEQDLDLVLDALELLHQVGTDSFRDVHDSGRQGWDAGWNRVKDLEFLIKFILELDDDFATFSKRG